MSQRTSKWFKTIEKVLCGLFFFAKFVVPILTSGGYVGLSIAIKNSRMFWCVRCPCGHGYEVKGIEERAVSAGQRP